MQGAGSASSSPTSRSTPRSCLSPDRSGLTPGPRSVTIRAAEKNDYVPLQRRSERLLTRPRSIWTFITTAVVSGLLLAGCGGGGSSSSEGPSGPVKEPTSPVTVTFESWVGNEKP